MMIILYICHMFYIMVNTLGTMRLTFIIFDMPRSAN
jgi:hypothetical protein